MPIDDIRRLAKAIGVRSAAQALDLVETFYPRQQIEPKTQFGLEEIFSKLGKRRGSLSRTKRSDHR